MLLFSLAYKSISSAPTLPSVHLQAKFCLHLAEYHLIQRFTELSEKKAGEATMFSAKRLVQMAKKWQRMAALARKRLASTPAKETKGSCGTSTPVAVKGHCVVYSADGRRFEVPLAYLGTAVFSELLSMSQEEFGFAGNDGRITLHCDAALMEYVICLLRKEASEEVERAFLSSMARPCHYGNGLTQPMGLSHQIAVSSF
ncbi:auxin-responsive protein SAUR36-like [Phragmites australis]|uniref:auxin-responsive protein SAUR36-like n=1 Tax=Phragmites australis TaxID=29695 RepID=UPI002D785AAF|nr:auxin-responsive protein SAUR36-like [Phragmites australis]